MPDPRPAPPAGWRPGPTLGVAAGLLLVLLPWWRNHEILRDFYDYGLVMAAAGRINAGERPYVDFLTPIQTVPLAVSALAERVGGARFLTLTFAQAVWLAAMFGGLTALLWRRAGPWLALAAAAAVVMASGGQHTIPWHNVMGVTWVTLVAWLLAHPPAHGRGQWLAVGGAALALWLSGMTKINFHAAALAFGLLLVARQALARRWCWRRAAGVGVLLLAAAVVLPPLTEMAWTGADWPTWRRNVLELAGGSRAAMLKELGQVRFYLRPPHDYYGPTGLPFAGLWVVLVAVAGAGVVWRAGHGKVGTLMAIAAFGGAAVCGLVLLATNQDISHVGVAAAFALVVGASLAFGADEAGRLGRGSRWVVGIGAVTLLAPTWWCAWAGQRALWGRTELDRAKLVALEGLPSRFAYVHGMRVPEAWRLSLEAMAARIDRTDDPSGFLFIHGTEWMVRAVPEAVHRGLPLWLHYGTTYSETARQPLADAIEYRRGIHTLVADRAWDLWFAGLRDIVRDFYIAREAGPLILAHEAIPESRLLRQDDPIAFVSHLGSNIFGPDVSARGDPVRLEEAAGGDALVSRRPHRLHVGPGFYRFEGEFFVEGPFDRAVHMQVLAGTAGSQDVIWDEKVMAADVGQKVVRFSVSPGGRPVELQAAFPGDARPRMGWRKLFTSHAGPAAAGPPGSVGRDLPTHPARADWAQFLFAPGGDGGRQLSLRGKLVLAEVREGTPEIFCQVPGEIWFPVGEGQTHVSGQFGFRSSAWTEDGALSGGAFLVFHYKSGRFQELFRRNLHPRAVATERSAQEFSTALPEPGGWVGLVVLPAVGEETNWGHAWWRNIRVR